MEELNYLKPVKKNFLICGTKFCQKIISELKELSEYDTDIPIYNYKENKFRCYYFGQSPNIMTSKFNLFLLIY